MATPEEMEAAMVANLEEKTGKPLQAWLKLAAGSGLAKHGQIVKFLKSEHGVTHGYANLIASRALKAGTGEDGDGDLVDAQYSGDKQALRPIYEKLVGEVTQFGKDVEVSPKKAYVSLRRNKQFAIVQPSTKTRVDVGVNLKDVPPSGRLEASGSFNAMVSHRVRVGQASDVDRQLIGWLRQAYDAS